ncbi:36711_t:CDS:2, partial [Racocetra persica]
TLFEDIKNKNKQLVTQMKSKSKLSESLLFGLQYKDLEKCLLEVVEAEKENFFNSDNNILIELQTQTIVKLIDHDRISRDAYRSLSKIDQSLIQASIVYNMRQEIIKQVNIKIPISLVDINQPTNFELIIKGNNIESIRK